VGSKPKSIVLFGSVAVLICFLWGRPLGAQQSVSPSAGSEHPRPQSDPLADLSVENRALFDALHDAVQTGRDADAAADGKKLLASIPPNTRLADFVTQVTAGSALETGDTASALTLIKSLADAHPNDWHAATLLARVYAESGEKSLQDQQIARVVALHKQTSDPNFAKLHVFPIQRVKLHSGYAVFLYPFEPLKPYNAYLVALIYTSDGKQDYRLELGSEDVDQAFFKPQKPGERRFSIDSYRKNEKDEKGPESQALHGLVDGVFDYDRMRDLMVKTANGESLPKN
jgi:hypothetical protein